MTTINRGFSLDYVAEYKLCEFVTFHSVFSLLF